jgi:hypothetical protein
VPVPVFLPPLSGVRNRVDITLNCAFPESPVLPLAVVVQIPPIALDFTVNVQEPIVPADTGQVGLGKAHR